jgi:hypothetical protein
MCAELRATMNNAHDRVKNVDDRMRIFHDIECSAHVIVTAGR